jgi:hypothetical protein
MSAPTRREKMDCTRARQILHERLDGDVVDLSVDREYRTHLATCAPCSAADRDMQSIQSGLRELPLIGLPDMALERVWRGTTRKRLGRAARLSFWGLDWRGVAAAAALAAVLLGVHGVRPTHPTEAELNQAAAEARMALLLTARALRQSEETVLREVLAKEVSPALGRAPIPRAAEGGSR